MGLMGLIDPVKECLGMVARAASFAASAAR